MRSAFPLAVPAKFILPAILAAGIFFAPPIAIGDTVLLNDTFTGTSLDSSLWNQTLPFGGSSVTVSGGSLNLSDRGFVTSTGSFTGPLQIDARVQLTGSGSVFSLVWKTDGVHTAGNPTVQTVGLEFDLFHESQFIAFGDTVSHSNHTSFALPLDTWFDVRIIDSGFDVSVYMNGAIAPTLQMAYDPTLIGGNGHLEIYPREGGRGANIDYITVTSSVPDAGSTLGLLVLSISGIALLRRRFGS